MESISPRHLDLIEARGISPETVQRVGLFSRAADRGGPDLLAIPFLVDGKAVNHKYRTLEGEKKFLQDKGATKCFWNYDALADASLRSEPLIITEGEFDAMAAMESGYVRVVSVPDGAPAKPIGEEAGGSKYTFLDHAKPLLTLANAPVIILAVDGDDAGANLLHDLSLRLGRPRCKWVTYPLTRDKSRRLKDLNEVLIEYGAAGVKAVIDRAQFLKVDGIYRMSGLPPVPDRAVLSHGMPVMKVHYIPRLGDMVVVTGIPSMGKTAFVNDIVARMIELHNTTACIASFEQMPQVDFRRNMRTWYLKKIPAYATVPELEAADAWIEKHFSFVYPDEEEDVTVDWLMEKAAASVLQHESKIVVVDPWNEMDHLRERNETMSEYVSRALKVFRRFARRFNVHLIVVAHPTKQEKRADGTWEVPTLYSISDSAAWYNKADVGIIVHRPDKLTSLLRVGKARYHYVNGLPGDVEATFIPHMGRFEVTDTTGVVDD